MVGVRRVYPQPPHPTAIHPRNPLDATGLPEDLADTGAPGDFESSSWHPDMQSYVIGGDEVGAMPLAPGEALAGVDVDLLMDETILAMERQIEGEYVDFGGIMDQSIHGGHVMGGEYENATDAGIARMQGALFAGKAPLVQVARPTAAPAIGADPAEVLSQSRDLRQRIRTMISQRSTPVASLSGTTIAGGLVLTGLALLLLIGLTRGKK